MTLKMIKRNVKLFFCDKGMFLTSLITPVILLVLYITFLGNVYRDSFLMNLPAQANIPDKLIDGLVGGQLISSILAVSCVTVAFCSNFVMVQDKATGAAKDLHISPARSSVFSLSYYVASIISTLIICFTAALLCLAYVAFTGWYMSVSDVLMLLIDMVLLVLFGTALSSIINYFLSTQGQISAVGSMVSSCYGFISGAYMPISSFGIGLQRVISFLPGTYGTVLLRTHALRGAIGELSKYGVPSKDIEALKDGIDCNLYFFDLKVSEAMMYVVLIGAILILAGAYVLMSMRKKKAK
jgi:multidrug/hemolysin transport system permease protein